MTEHKHFFVIFNFCVCVYALAVHLRVVKEIGLVAEGVLSASIVDITAISIPLN